jgi:nitrogen regulatory protein PII
MIHICHRRANSRFQRHSDAHPERIDPAFAGFKTLRSRRLARLLKRIVTGRPSLIAATRRPNDATYNKTGKAKMKLTLAIIKPLESGDVLVPLDVQGSAVSEVKRCDDQNGQIGIFRGAEYQAGFRPETNIEMVVSGHRAECVVEAIAKRGRIGGGEIFVTGAEQTIRVRNSEIGAAAH